MQDLTLPMAWSRVILTHVTVNPCPAAATLPTFYLLPFLCPFLSDCAPQMPSSRKILRPFEAVADYMPHLPPSSRIRR